MGILFGQDLYVEFQSYFISFYQIKQMHSHRSQQKEYQELQRLKQQLNQKMTISTISESSSPNKLPSIRPQRVRTRLDRYATQKIRYQNNLSSVLADIRSKMDIENDQDIFGLKPRHIKHRVYTTLANSKGQDMTVKTMNLSPKKEFQKIEIEIPNKHRSPSPRKLKKEKILNKFDLTGFEPWQTGEDVDTHNLPCQF